jgi:hypothetical protein
VKIKSLAATALSLAFASVAILPLSAQATDDCDIFLNPSCQFEYGDGWMQLMGKWGESTSSITLSSPQSRLEFRLITPSAAVLSELGGTQHGSNTQCFLDEETSFSVWYSTELGAGSNVVFEGQPQTVQSSITPYGGHSLVTASFEIPQSASLGIFTCSSGFGVSSGPNTGFGDSYNFTLTLSRSFTPSASTPSASTPSATPSKASASPSPSASAQAADEESDAEASSTKSEVLADPESKSDVPPIGFLIVGTLSAFAGIGATVAYFQRKAIARLISRFRKTAKF